MKKKIAVIVVFSMLLFTMPMSAMAEIVTDTQEQEVTVVQPRFSYIVEAENALSINGTTATVDCWVNGQIGNATKAKVIAELQVKSGSNWIAYGTWVDTQNDYEAYVYETKSVKAGNTYRVKATFTVWEGSQSETLVSYTDEMTA